MTQRLPDNNLMIKDYLQELLVLSSEIVRIYREIESIVQTYRPGMEGVLSFPGNPAKYFFIKPEVFTRIATIQVHSSNIKKILFATPRKKDEAKIKYDYRVKRATEIQKHFNMEQITEIKNSDVRNSLEHYDERLDNISLRLWNRSIPEKYHIIATNIVLSSEGALYGNPYYLKCYIIDTKVYKNAEKESNLGKIIQEAEYIYGITKNQIQSDQMAGSVIIIPPRN